MSRGMRRALSMALPGLAPKKVCSKKIYVFALRLAPLTMGIFNDAQTTLNSHIEVRQFTAACELVCNGIGVSIVSELDAVKYSSLGLSYRPFKPALPHRLSLVRPILKKPSLVTLEFIEHFRDSLRPYVA